MVLLDKIWDDVVAGPHPERGLGKLRKIDLKAVEEAGSSKYGRSISLPGPASPGTPATPGTPVTPGSGGRKATENVWRSVFNPGSNLATKTLGAQLFDKPNPNTPTVYDWMYRGESRIEHR